mmetsp:Transcript_63092/g.173156  ORF Transcript_63092/g.173156 Transcript_63092/m.173156 type:complete len:218 (-) Transcript_63092:44-697(-)
MSSVVSLGRREHTVHPREKLLAAVVRVENDRYAILLRHGAHVVRARHSAGNGGFEVRVVEPLARVELRATRRELDDDRGIVLPGRLKAGVDGGRGHTVHRRNGVAVVLRVLEQVLQRLARHHARVHRGRHVRVRRQRALVLARNAHLLRGHTHAWGDTRRLARADRSGTEVGARGRGERHGRRRQAEGNDGTHGRGESGGRTVSRVRAAVVGRVTRR